jgi:hypothetical protein
MNKQNTTRLMEAFFESEKLGTFVDNMFDLLKEEDINELCCDNETFPYLYRIHTGHTGPEAYFRDNPKLDLNNKNKYGETVLMALAKTANYEDSKILIERGADWKMKDINGKTAMDYAREYAEETDKTKMECSEGNNPKIYRYYQKLNGDIDSFWGE